MDEQMNIGFVGLGIMGKPMALNILKKGAWPLFVYNRTESKAKEVIDAGASLCHSPFEVAQKSNVIITMVSDTGDVESVIFGENGIAKGAKVGSVIVDMSTISPSATRMMAKKLSDMGIEMMDCPVSGGDIGAANGTLTIMCGGKQEIFDKVKPILECMGTKITYMGSCGAGQATKLGNQTVIVSTLLGVCEGLMLASKEGLDLEKFIEALSGGWAQSAQLSFLGPKMVKRDFSPGFMIDLMQKDLRLILQSVQAHHLSLPGASLVAQLMNSVQADPEGGKLGTPALIKALEKLAGYEI